MSSLADNRSAFTLTAGILLIKTSIAKDHLEKVVIYSLRYCSYGSIESLSE